MYGTVHCATTNLTGRHIQLAVRNCRWASLPRRLAGTMVHRSLLPATAPPWFPADRLGSCASLAAGCGFVRAESVRGSDAAAPGKCRRCGRSGLTISQDRTCSHSPSKGSLWVRRQPRTRFLRSCSRYKVSSPAVGSGAFLSEGALARCTLFYRKDVERGGKEG
jgi:hypothetical protein